MQKPESPSNIILSCSNYDSVPHPLNVLIEKPNNWLCGAGVILSANTTDKAVNKIMPEFRKAFPNYTDILKPDVSKDFIVSLLPGINHSGSKSDYLINFASHLQENNGDTVKTIKEFTEVKGIGRKTAAVILYALYSIDEGFPLDTHCMRILKRLEWYNSKNPKSMENLLLKDFPEGTRYKSHMILTQHGRHICKPSNPLCSKCYLSDYCAFFKNKTT